MGDACTLKSVNRNCSEVKSPVLVLIMGPLMARLGTREMADVASTLVSEPCQQKNGRGSPGSDKVWTWRCFLFYVQNSGKA